MENKLQTIRQNIEKGVAVSNWGLEKYKEVLGIDMAKMEGKTVLDIGSGKAEKFSKEAAKFGVKVVSMGTHLKDGIPKNMYDEKSKTFLKDRQGFSVAARAQELPFEDNFFDYEVALYSLPFYLPYSRDEYSSFFKEVIRTLKPGGKAYFSPIYKNQALEKDIVSAQLISSILDDFSDSIMYKIEKLNHEDKECRLILIKK